MGKFRNSKNKNRNRNKDRDRDNHHGKNAFFSEIKEKKLLSYSAKKKKASSLGPRGNKPLLTPYFFASNKEKLEMNGEVKTMNLKSVESFEQFKSMDNNLKGVAIATWNEHFRNEEIMTLLDLNDKELKDLFSQYGFEARNRPINHIKRLHGDVEISESELKSFNEETTIFFLDFMQYSRNSQKNILWHLKNELYPELSIARIIRKVFNVRFETYFNTLYHERRRELEKESNKANKKNVSTGKTAPANVIKQKDTPIVKEEPVTFIQPVVVDPISEMVVQVAATTNEVIEPVMIQENPQVMPIATPVINKDADTNVHIAFKGISLQMEGTYSKENIVRKLQFIVDELSDSKESFDMKISLNLTEQQ